MPTAAVRVGTARKRARLCPPYACFITFGRPIVSSHCPKKADSRSIGKRHARVRVGYARTDAVGLIVAIPALLEMAEIESAIITIDAMGCQREDVEIFAAEQKANGFNDTKVSACGRCQSSLYGAGANPPTRLGLIVIFKNRYVTVSAIPSTNDVCIWFAFFVFHLKVTMRTPLHLIPPRGPTRPHNLNIHAGMQIAIAGMQISVAQKR